MGGTTLAALVALGGVVAYFHRTTQDIVARCELKIEQERTERRHELDKLGQALTEERAERRRELDRVERTVEGFADVASAVVAMGKSLEHVSERQSDHQQQYREDMSELKSSIRSIETRLMDAGKG